MHHRVGQDASASTRRRVDKSVKGEKVHAQGKCSFTGALRRNVPDLRGECADNVIGVGERKDICYDSEERVVRVSSRQ